MKKFVTIAAALATVGLAGCNNSKTEEVNTTDANLEATTDAAVTDVNAATTDAVNAADATLNDVGNSVENTANAIHSEANGAADEAQTNGL